MSYKRQGTGARNKTGIELEHDWNGSIGDRFYDDDDDDDRPNDDVTDDKKDKKYDDDELSEALTEEEVKVKLRQLGLMLKAKVKAYISMYNHNDIAFDAVEKSSKKVNKCEARFGKYLSFVVRNEEIYQNYMRTHLIKVSNQQQLDKAMAVWLQRFNPHIVELTSYARAKWVAESMVRVFENEWKTLYSSTRAKHIPRVTDQEILECIKHVVQFIYNKSKDFAWRQSMKILQLLYLTTNYTMTNCPAVVRLRIRELMKRSTAHTLPFIQKVIRRDLVRESNLRLLLRVHNVQKPPLRTFVDLCSEITWFMQSQDPPMTLEFTKDSEVTHFKPYKTIGCDISFIIWPTVLQHDDEMVLANGLAEFIERSHQSSPSSPLIPFEPHSADSVDW